MDKAGADSTGRVRRYSSIKRDRRRAEIVAVATDELNTHGVQGLVLADVAARVGMTKANLSYYFRRKEDLAAQCIDLTLAEYGQMIARSAEQPNARARVCALFEHFFERAARAAEGQATPLAGLGVLPALEEPYASHALEQYRQLLRAAAGLFLEAEGPRLGRVARIARAQLILTQLFWFSSWLDQCDPGDYRRIARRMFDVIGDGLAGDADARELALGEPATAAEDVDPQPQRAAFHQAAIRLINQFGYRGASVERISAAVNLTKGSVYHHHASKEDLVLACAERSFGAMWAIIRAAEREDSGARRRLTAVIVALIAHQASDRGPFLRASALSALPPALREQVARRWARITHHLAGLVSDAVAEGTIRPVDPVIAAQVIAAALNAADEIHRFGPNGQINIHGACTAPLLRGLFADDTAADHAQGPLDRV